MAFTSAALTPNVQIRPAAVRFGAPVLAPLTRSARRSTKVSKKYTVTVRAQKKTVSSPEVEDIVKNVSDKWEGVEDKPTFLLYTAGALAALWVVANVVGAVNTLPLLPKFLELIGLLYSAWFVYRYLLFKSNREELVSDIDDLKKKISGQDGSS